MRQGGLGVGLRSFLVGFRGTTRIKKKDALLKSVHGKRDAGKTFWAMT